MQAKVAREGEIVVLHLEGRVDVETAEPFRKACLTQLLGNKTVFDFRSLSFVGSSGVLPFLETLQEFANRNVSGIKFSGVGTEFKKVFAATTLNAIEIFETHQQAIHAFVHPRPVQVLEPVQAAPINIEAAAELNQQIAAVPAPSNFGLLSFKHDAASEMPPAQEYTEDEEY